MKYVAETGEPTGRVSHVAEGLELLRRLPRWNHARNIAFLRSWLEEIDAVEGAAWDFWTGRFLDTATGVFLDAWGSIVLEPRAGEGNAPYRARIKLKIALMLSRGTHSDYLRIAKMAASPADVFVTGGHAVTRVQIFGVPEQSRERVRGWLRAAAPPGEGCSIAYTSEAYTGGAPLVAVSVHSTVIRAASRNPESKTNPGRGGRSLGVF